MEMRTMCFALILVLGTHIVTSKSVVESFKDELAHPQELVLIKRDVNEGSNVTEEETTEVEEETTTSPSTESTEYDETTPAPIVTSTKPPQARRQTARPSKAPQATTPSSVQDRSDDTEPIVEEADDQEEANTVKPVEIENPKPPKKQKKPKPAAPSLDSRSRPVENGESMAASGVQQPATNLLPPMPSLNIPLSDFIPPQFPAFGFAPQPALPGPYYYPQPSGPAFSVPQNGASASAGSFASASASASANGQGATVSTSTFPGSGTQQSSSSFSGPAPGGAVGSQSPGPFGGSFSGPGVQHSSSSSSSFPGGVSQQSSSSSASSSSPGGFSQQSSSSSSGPFSSVSQNPSSITIRGSFGDNESVGIEVNGPEPAGNAAPGPNYGYSGPGYAGAGASSYNAPYYNSYNSIPNYSPYGNSADLQSFFQQYFAALQAQQLAFQRQLQAQIQAQQQAGGTSATAGAFMSDSKGQADPNAQVFVSTQSSPNSASASTSVDSRFGLGGAKSTVLAQPPADMNSKNSYWDQSNRIDSNFNNVPSGPYYNGPQIASASGSIGPNGGFQTGQISPAAPGIFSRFGESIPAPSGNSYGVFSSSSSSSSTGPDGKVKSQKSATVAVNDNGKVTVKHVHDP